MKIAYELIESAIHGYQGIEVSQKDVKAYFPNEVKEKLNDFEGTNELVETFSTSIPLTGFDINVILLDVFSLDVPATEWRIGETFSEVYLEKEKGARFYWSEIKDQRNINSNKTGADLVGFIDMNGETVFLFGEVKTSNDPNRPPQVLYGKSGMIKQLEDLASDRKKVCALIRYLGTKAIMYRTTDPFRLDYEKALNTFISNMDKFHLFGVLVRDNDPDERDLKQRYKSLKAKINKVTGLQLLALYIPIVQSRWQSIVNGTNE
ncbi:MAG: hypothetical protein ICV66_04160 [Chitinophagaceae bacterium]|nr:hypothetical protein [Chitinophagaceae bacterium]